MRAAQGLWRERGNARRGHGMLACFAATMLATTWTDAQLTAADYNGMAACANKAMVMIDPSLNSVEAQRTSRELCNVSPVPSDAWSLLVNTLGKIGPPFTFVSANHPVRALLLQNLGRTAEARALIERCKSDYSCRQSVGAKINGIEEAIFHNEATYTSNGFSVTLRCTDASDIFVKMASPGGGAEVGQYVPVYKHSSGKGQFVLSAYKYWIDASVVDAAPHIELAIRCNRGKVFHRKGCAPDKAECLVSAANGEEVDLSCVDEQEQVAGAGGAAGVGGSGGAGSGGNPDKASWLGLTGRVDADVFTADTGGALVLGPTLRLGEHVEMMSGLMGVPGSPSRGHWGLWLGGAYWILPLSDKAGAGNFGPFIGAPVFLTTFKGGDYFTPGLHGSVAVRFNFADKASVNAGVGGQRYFRDVSAQGTQRSSLAVLSIGLNYSF